MTILLFYYTKKKIIFIEKKLQTQCKDDGKKEKLYEKNILKIQNKKLRRMKIDSFLYLIENSKGVSWSWYNFFLYLYVIPKISNWNKNRTKKKKKINQSGQNRAIMQSGNNLLNLL